MNSLRKRFQGKITVAKSEELFLLVTKHVTVRFHCLPFVFVDEFENVMASMSLKFTQRLGPPGT